MIGDTVTGMGDGVKVGTVVNATLGFTILTENSNLRASVRLNPIYPELFFTYLIIILILIVLFFRGERRVEAD